MYYLASINAYDAMGYVVVAAAVRASTGAPGSDLEVVLATSTRLDGVGEDDPRRWLRDALVGLAETL